MLVAISFPVSITLVVRYDLRQTTYIKLEGSWQQIT